MSVGIVEEGLVDVLSIGYNLKGWTISLVNNIYIHEKTWFFKGKL